GRETLVILRLLGPLSGGSPYSNIKPSVFSDMNNGTIKREQFNESCSPAGDCTYTNAYPVIYIKKCLYGQQYRLAENDCRGTGNSGNFYGALKVQFCATDDQACEDGQGFATSASPAYQACAGDSTAGKTWTLPIISAQYFPARTSQGNQPNSYPEKLFDENFLQVSTEMPYGWSHSAWHSVQVGGIGTEFYVDQNFTTTYSDVNARNRTFYAFVLCMSLE
ncbi:MAG: hypothetical protein KDK37_16720, partial [Leptospiraceae bacterium]|nr:hypothetical protein [Leptospiraceae bacterium]